eukprot:scaffold2585_cov368-Prasinococcus_capsulatus_cf.AAC.17
MAHVARARARRKPPPEKRPTRRRGCADGRARHGPPTRTCARIYLPLVGRRVVPALAGKRASAGRPGVAPSRQPGGGAATAPGGRAGRGRGRSGPRAQARGRAGRAPGRGLRCLRCRRVACRGARPACATTTRARGAARRDRDRAGAAP